jgi:hypothetical protein
LVLGNCRGLRQEGEHNVEHGAWATTTDTEGSCTGITSTMDATGGLTRQHHQEARHQQPASMMTKPPTDRAKQG